MEDNICESFEPLQSLVEHASPLNLSLPNHLILVLLKWSPLNLSPLSHLILMLLNSSPLNLSLLSHLILLLNLCHLTSQLVSLTIFHSFLKCIQAERLF